jgi:NTE family protein
LIDDELLLDRLEQAFGERTFADAEIPLHLVATDLHSGERVVLNRGRIVDAIRASLAIPLLFAPWPSGDRLLVDGAASDPLPVDVAMQEGAGLILAMGFELPTPARLRSYTAVTAHFNSLYMNNILKTSFAFHTLAHHSEVIPVLPQFDRPVGTFDTQQLAYVIEQGARAAEKLLPYLQQLVRTPD